MTQKWALCIHGGAGDVDSDDPAGLQAARDGLTAALRAGSDVLARGGTALDAVEAAVVSLEDCPLFNSAKGAVYTRSGKHELEASIATSDLRCGSVALLRRTRNPIKLARAVMAGSPHVFLSGDDAEAFGERQGLAMVPNEYFDTATALAELQQHLKENARMAALRGDAAAVEQQKLRQVPETCGAVAVDAAGTLAAATSTGGRTAKWDGRIGDTPVHGAGTYANAHMAASGTGLGEEFIRHGVCKDVAARMLYLGASLDAAVAGVVDGVLQPGDGGVIAVDMNYNCCLHFSSQVMYRGAADHTGRLDVGIYQDDFGPAER